MTGSENLWSEDELLTQLEEMQDEIDSLKKEKEGLARELEEKDSRIQEPEQEQMSSSERSKLQSALQQAQKKVQEQSEQIVKLSSADLILKDNEKLKEENGKLKREKEQSEKEAARVEEACKARIKRKDREVQRKFKEAEEKKAEAQKKEKKADELLRDRERLIREEVEKREEELRDDYIRRKRWALIDAEDKCEAEKKGLARWGIAVSLYALAVTILLTSTSETYKAALKTAGRQIGDIAENGYKRLLGLVERASEASRRIPVPVRKDVAYWIIMIAIAAICILVLLGIAILLFRKIRKVLSLATAWPVFLGLCMIVAITVVFGNTFQKRCPINIVYADMLLWLICIVFRVVIARRKRR